MEADPNPMPEVTLFPRLEAVAKAVGWLLKPGMHHPSGEAQELAIEAQNRSDYEARLVVED